MPNHKDKIIYIAGFPRSGTTWFANLLNAHPQTVYRHEILGRCFEQFDPELLDMEQMFLDMFNIDDQPDLTPPNRTMFD